MLRRTSKFSLRNIHRRQVRRALEILGVQEAVKRGLSLNKRQEQIALRLQLLAEPGV